MDYKFIILLIVMVLFVLFILSKLDSIEAGLCSQIIQLTASVDNNSKSLKYKFQSDLSGCVNKIKALNGEYIAQVRRMNTYGSQPITNISNHYTDSETDKNNNPINYLSDVKNESNLNKQQNNNEQSFYMSDDIKDNKKTAKVNIK